jgi:hypothetical protein
MSPIKSYRFWWPRSSPVLSHRCCFPLSRAKCRNSALKLATTKFVDIISDSALTHSPASIYNISNWKFYLTLKGLNFFAVILSRIYGRNHFWRQIVTWLGFRDGFWIGWLDLLALQLQLQSIITAHNQLLLKTRSIPCWITSVFSSTVTD